MASRSEEVFILLRAIGSAAARRQIDDVADALGRLNSETGSHADATKEDTTVTDKNTQSIKRNATATKNSVRVNKEFTKGQQAMLNGLKRYAKGDIGLTRNRLDQFKARQKIDGMVKRANEKVLREQNVAAKAEERANRVHQQEMAKVRNQTIKAERDLANRLAREHKAQERELARHLKEQERQEKLSHRKRRQFKLPARAGFQSPIRVAAIGSLVAGALDSINFLATGLNAVAAGSIAAVNGLAPLAGMLVTLPAGMMAFAQATIVTKMAFSGIGKAIGGDADALAALPENARQFALASMLLKQTYKGLQRSVQNSLFKGLGDEALLLGNRYLPILNKRLNETARGLNRAAVNLSGWLRSKKGVQVVNDLMKSNSVVIENGAFSANHLLEAFLRIGRSAGPMMRLLSKDVRRVTNDLANWTEKNDKKITRFFLGSYKLFKKTLRVIGDYGSGIINIFKQSDSLSEHMGKNVEKTGKSFRKWTESEKGIKAIRKYFREMQPNLDAVTRLSGHLLRDIFDIGRSKGFADTVNVIDNKLRPALKKIIQESDGKFLPALITVIEGIEILADSGVIDTISQAMLGAAKAFLWVAKKFAGLPQWTKDFIVWGLVFYGILAKPLGVAIKLLSSIGKIGKLLAGMKVSKSLLALLGLGGAAGVGGGGKGGGGGGVITGGGGKAGGKVGRTKGIRGGAKAAGRAIGSVLGPVGIAYTIGSIVAPMIDVNRGSLNPGAKVGKKGDTNSFFKGADGKGISGKHGFGFKSLSAREINSTSTALARLFKPTRYEKVGGFFDKISHSIFGTTTDVTKAKNAFANLDNKLTKTKAKDAQSAFGKLRIEAEKQRIPVDKLIGLFPKYRDKVSASGAAAKIMASRLYTASEKAQIMSGKLNGIPVPAGRAGEKMLNASYKAKKLAEKAKNAADESGKAGSRIQNMGEHASSSAGGLGKASDKAGSLATNLHKVGKQVDFFKLSKYKQIALVSQNLGYDIGGKKRFAGGMTQPGERYITGEIGPEATITRSGKLGITGLLGQQAYSPKEPTAIIPASATSNPESGNYGNAPGWAKTLYQSGMAGTQDKVRAAAPIARNAEKKNDTMGGPLITITGNTISNNVDLERVVRQAIMSYEREKRERR